MTEQVRGMGLFLVCCHKLLCMHVYKDLMRCKSVCDIKQGVRCMRAIKINHSNEKLVMQTAGRRFFLQGSLRQVFSVLSHCAIKGGIALASSEFFFLCMLHPCLVPLKRLASTPTEIFERKTDCQQSNCYIPA